MNGWIVQRPVCGNEFFTENRIGKNIEAIGKNVVRAPALKLLFIRGIAGILYLYR